jgi:hypothetical protein
MGFHHAVVYPWLLFWRGALTNTLPKKLIAYRLIEPPLASRIVMDEFPRDHVRNETEVLRIFAAAHRGLDQNRRKYTSC